MSDRYEPQVLKPPHPCDECRLYAVESDLCKGCKDIKEWREGRRAR